MQNTNAMVSFLRSRHLQIEHFKTKINKENKPKISKNNEIYKKQQKLCIVYIRKQGSWAFLFLFHIYLTNWFLYDPAIDEAGPVSFLPFILVSCDFHVSLDNRSSFNFVLMYITLQNGGFHCGVFINIEKTKLTTLLSGIFLCFVWVSISFLTNPADRLQYGICSPSGQRPL